MYISIGRTRKDIHWQVQDMTWEELCERLSKTLYTSETVADYKAMTKDEKSAKKDNGGFVGGVVVGGRRVRSSIKCRTLVTLDADFATPNLWDDCEMLLDYKMCCYTTHSHTPKNPRLRFVIPLDREVTPEEYEPIARMVASDIGIDTFDITTYETNRLMYWPSTPCDGEFIFKKMDGNTLCANEILARYDNWRDITEWPIGEGETNVRVKEAKSQGDPETKPGLVGAFCRTYDIHSAIETFLPDEYTQVDDGTDRYTYTKGSTAGGLVVYNDGKFAFSFHQTDPACGHLCNAFDLIRLHKFAILDEGKDKYESITKMPSYKAMCEFVQEDAEVKKTMVAEGLLNAKEVFADEFDELDWTAKLKINKNNAVETTASNIELILENDPRFKGCFATNTFTSRMCFVKDLPWRKCDDKINGTPWEDGDDAQLRCILENTYQIVGSNKIGDVLQVVMQKHSYHPVRRYLESLSWDGITRGERLFIHYLGAEDNVYVRTVTKKWLTAAVTRVMRPGCKFDNLVVLVGAQGIGKSYMGNKLGRGWFSDTFSTVQGKDAYDQLKGRWIVEIGELSAMKKAEVESVKQFISKQVDDYRAAYDRHNKANARQCVFYGTTNDDSFLRDQTGNRRFWPIEVDKDRALYDVFELDDATMDQIWAEAYHWYSSGETLYLDARLTKLAETEQEKFMTVDPRQGLVEDYLNRPLPKNWYELDKTSRRNYIQGFTSLSEGEETFIRQEINVAEIAYEVFGEEIVEPYKAKDYHNIIRALHCWKKSGVRKRTAYGQQFIYVRTNEGEN